jgi:predicted nucleotide-binding protein
MHAGIVVADVSALNANVFYELGLAHAFGKDAVILRQANSKIPADIGGAHYHEYDLQSLDDGKAWLRSELAHWAQDNRSQVIKLLRGR